MLRAISRAASSALRQFAESLEPRRLLSAASTQLFVQSLDGNASSSIIVVSNAGLSTTGTTSIKIENEGLKTSTPGTATINVPHAVSVEIADVNGDGYPDIIMVRDASGGLANGKRTYVAMLNDGAGNFSLSRTQNLFTFDKALGDLVCVGDINGDGIADCLVRTAGQSNSYHADLGGATSSSPSFTLPAGSTIAGLADLDGDGALDVVSLTVASTGTFIGVCFGDGTGAFAADRESSTPSVSELTLVNENGLSQVGAITPTAKGLMMNFYGIVDSSLKLVQTASATLPSDFPTTGVQAVDLNSDGLPDLLAISKDGTTVRCLTQDPNATTIQYRETDFQPSNAALQGSSVLLTNVAVGDVDGDGVLDLVCIGGPISNSQIEDIYLTHDPVFDGNGLSSQTLDPIDQINGPLDMVRQSSQVIRKQSMDATPEEFAAIFNEGDLTSGPTEIDLYSAPNDGASSPPGPVQSYMVPHVLEAFGADVNGDGYTDLILVRRDLSPITGLPTGKLDFTVLDGKSGFDPKTARTTYGPHADVVDCVADINGDGRADLVFHRDLGSTNVYYTYFSNGNGTFRPSAVNGRILPSTLLLAGAADINHDGRADFVFESRTASDIAAGQASGIVIVPGLGNGDVWGNNASARISLSLSNIVSVILSDFNGDGSPDIGLVTTTPLSTGGTGLSFTLVTNTNIASGRVKLRQGVGLAIPDSEQGMQVVAGDLNGDGQADLVVTDGTTILPFATVGDLSNGGSLFAGTPITMPNPISDVCVVPLDSADHAGSIVSINDTSAFVDYVVSPPNLTFTTQSELPRNG